MDTPYLRRVEKRASIIFYIRSSCTCNENLWAKLHNNALKVQVLFIECTMYMEKDFFFFLYAREREKERDYLYNYIHIYKLGFRMFSKVWNCRLTYIIIMREPEYDIPQTDLEFMSKCELQGVLTAILQSLYDLQAILQVPNLDNR